ncbi:TlpA disulfide reductase family protein [Specibacter cremeus]|uniref:TlpA family protein disulfide reductase n=1 Tax=Specibacter cremeus TaxID=1629051 RepID=UPI00197CB4E7
MDQFVTSSISRRGLLAATGAALALGLAACASTDPLAKQANAGDGKNYIAGDGSVTEYKAADRRQVTGLTGTLFDGTKVDSASFTGHITVLNLWYAACSPCRAEAPGLQALHTEFAPQGVQFYGVNIRDEKATAEAFDRTFGLTYPSFNDKDGGVLLALTRYGVPPAAVPTTLVLDRQGRISARILGQADKGTLRALITTVVGEK